MAKSTHGGKRKNAGRKPTPGMVRVNITLQPDDDLIAKRLGRGDRSKGIRLALRAAKAIAAAE